MKTPDRDRSILRELAHRQAEAAALPENAERRAEWTRLNGRRPGRPLVWINEMPWHEMDVNGELELHCSDDFCRQTEQGLRRTLYQWDHMRADMIIDGEIYSPLVIRDTGFGIAQEVAAIAENGRPGLHTKLYRPQINDEQDVRRIKPPQVTHDEAASEENYQTLVGLVGDILPVKQTGITHIWFSPWDALITWWGVEQALMDLALRPELVHQAMDRLVDANLSRLEQLEALGLLCWTNGNHRVGSGGLGCTDELPQPDFDPARVRPFDQWGCATAQIFSEVSPEMHEEFALSYERRWLDRFGLTYYGCCEPLHHKIDLLRTVPNLRKVSMSPKADVATMVEAAGDRYVLSYKPNPAILATDTWNPVRARHELAAVLDRTRGCVVEIIMKDITTVRDEPQRLWKWSRMAAEVARSHG